MRVATLFVLCGLQLFAFTGCTVRGFLGGKNNVLIPVKWTINEPYYGRVFIVEPREPTNAATSKGHPLPGARVTLEAEDAVYKTTTDEKGYFFIEEHTETRWFSSTDRKGSILITFVVESSGYPTLVSFRPGKTYIQLDDKQFQETNGKGVLGFILMSAEEYNAQRQGAQP